MDKETLYEQGEYWRFDHNQGFHEEDAEFKGRHIVDLLKQQGLDDKCSSVLDIGCGSGKVLSVVTSALGARGHGIDLSFPAIERANRLHAGPDITFSLGAVEDLTETYDLAISCDVFEHVDDYLGFLANCRGVARYFVFNIPLDMSVRSVLMKSYMGVRERYGHLHYFSADSARASVDYSGYRVLGQKFAPQYGHMLVKHRSLKAALGAAPFYFLNLFSTKLAVDVVGGSSLVVLAESRTQKMLAA